MVGTSGRIPVRLRLVTANARSLPALMLGERHDLAAHHHRHTSRKHVGQCLAVAPVGDVQQVNGDTH